MYLMIREWLQKYKIKLQILLFKLQKITLKHIHLQEKMKRYKGGKLSPPNLILQKNCQSENFARGTQQQNFVKTLIKKSNRDAVGDMLHCLKLVPHQLYCKCQGSTWIKIIVSHLSYVLGLIIVIRNGKIVWNLTNDPKHRGSILKNMASSEGDQLLAGAFHAIMGKIEAGILQIAKK